VEQELPFQKGRSKTGGRVKGTRNKAVVARETARQAFEIAMAGEPRCTPLQVMYAVMEARLGNGDLDGALSAAKEAAPYVHARLNATDVNVRHSITDKSDAAVAAEIESLRAKIALARSVLPMQIEATAEPVESVETSTAQS
jgi:hypothetical protein